MVTLKFPVSKGDRFIFNKQEYTVDHVAYESRKKFIYYKNQQTQTSVKVRVSDIKIIVKSHPITAKLPLGETASGVDVKTESVVEGTVIGAEYGDTYLVYLESENSIYSVLADTLKVR